MRSRRFRVRIRQQLRFDLAFGLGILALLYVGFSAYEGERKVMNLRSKATQLRHLVDQLDGVLFDLQAVEVGRLTEILRPGAGRGRAAEHLNRLRSQMVSTAQLLAGEGVDDEQKARREAFHRIERMVVLRVEAIRADFGKGRSVRNFADEQIKLETVQGAILAFHEQEDNRVQAWLLEANSVGEATLKVILLTCLMAFMLLGIALVVVVRDQRRLITTRENAIRAVRVKSEFLANMSHEIRTPMNAIVGLADMLAETPLNPDQRKYVDSFRRAGNTLLNLINDILDLSRVESGRLELDEIPFDLTEVLDGCVELLAVRASQKGISLGVQMDLEVPRHLVGDPNRLRQVLTNLLGNAVKFTRVGSVTLRVQRMGGSGPGAVRIAFVVTDTGIGMKAEEAARIFEKFRQANPTIYREFGGTGLGLTISEKLVHLMGGEIEVSSKPGEGSVFSFTIPLRLQAAQQPSLSEPRRDVELRKIRVLVADDSEDNRMLVRLYLKATPFALEFAENGAIALAKQKAERFDVVFMDVNMPEMDGYSATRAIRSWESETGGLPSHIIALTANGSKDEAEKSFNAGCDGHLTKPVKRDMLIRAISEIHQLDWVVAQPPGPVGSAERRADDQREKIVIHAPEEVKELLPGYVANRYKDIEKLQGAIAASELKTVRSIGHNVRGTAESYGMAELGEIAARLEESSERGDLDGVRAGVADFARFVQRIEIAAD